MDKVLDINIVIPNDVLSAFAKVVYFELLKALEKEEVNDETGRL